MAKKHQEEENKGIWKGLHESDFISESSSQDVSLYDYNRESLSIYMANVNYSRQFTRPIDGLKPIDRRIVYMLFKDGLRWNKKPAKSNTAVGDINKIHPHGDGPIYEAMMNNSQFWKKSQPLVAFEGNFGSELKPKSYAAPRYTEARLSAYADDCFFSDYLEESIEWVPSTIMDDFKEPIYLPAKYPNGLINGTYGFATGNQGCCPPYNIKDLHDAILKLMKNQDAEVNLIPEVPTGCDIVDNGTLKDICDAGTGVLRMRARIDIEQGVYSDGSRKKIPCWRLIVKSIPWMTDFEKVEEQIINLGKSKSLPILDTQNNSYPYHDKTDGYDKQFIDFHIILPYEYDPYHARDILFKRTQLDCSLAVKVQIVTDELQMMDVSVREYLLIWIRSRREYKRRLINRKLIKYQEELSLIKGLLKICDTDKKIDKFIKVIRKTKSDEEIIEKLTSEFGLNSHQRSKLYNVGVNKLNNGSLEKWNNEVIRLQKEIDKLYELAKSPKKIDATIIEDMEDMLKYNKPKKCTLISLEDHQVVADTNHYIVITNEGYIKKLPTTGHPKTGSIYGSIAPGDYPIHLVDINNLDSLLLFDSKGKYSIIPVSEIPNTQYSDYGNKIYDIAKLDGKIVLAIQYLNDSVLRRMKRAVPKEDFTGFEFVTISKSGMVKRTPCKEIQLNGRSAVKASPYVKLAEGDEITYVQFLFTNINLLIYTEMGDFSFIPLNTIKSMGKNAMGLRCMPMNDTDRVIGCSPVGPKDNQVVILTEKGYMKRISTDALGIKKRKQTSYLITLADGDKVIFCDAINTEEVNMVSVGTKNTLHDIPLSKVKEMTRMRAGDKLVPVPMGDNIIYMVFGRQDGLNE